MASKEPLPLTWQVTVGDSEYAQKWGLQPGTEYQFQVEKSSASFWQSGKKKCEIKRSVIRLCGIR